MQKRAAERSLRAEGFSRTEAKRAVARVPLIARLPRAILLRLARRIANRQRGGEA